MKLMEWKMEWPRTRLAAALLISALAMGCGTSRRDVARVESTLSTNPTALAPAGYAQVPVTAAPIAVVPNPQAGSVYGPPLTGPHGPPTAIAGPAPIAAAPPPGLVAAPTPAPVPAPGPMPGPVGPAVTYTAAPRAVVYGPTIQTPANFMAPTTGSTFTPAGGFPIGVTPTPAPQPISQAATSGFRLNPVPGPSAAQSIPTSINFLGDAQPAGLTLQPRPSPSVIRADGRSAPPSASPGVSPAEPRRRPSVDDTPLPPDESPLPTKPLKKLPDPTLPKGVAPRSQPGPSAANPAAPPPPIQIPSSPKQLPRDEAPKVTIPTDPGDEAPK